MKLLTQALPESERLIFRRLNINDVDAWMEYFASDEALKFMPLKLNDREDCIAWIKRAEWRYDTFGMGLWALIDKESNEIVGQCGLLVQEIDNTQELEIGYHLIPRFWKKGFAIEAALACKKFAIENKLADSVISIIHIDNINSQKVAERNGMIREKQTTFWDYPVYVYRVNIA